MAEERLIRKYANRRLYDAHDSRHVTLDDLRKLIAGGQRIKVVDDKSGEDITRQVLTQIIVDEEARGGETMLPINFLKQLIGLYGNSMQNFVPQYLEAAMDSFQRNQSAVRDAFGGNVLADIAKRNMAMFEDAMRLFQPFAACKDQRADAPSPGPARSSGPSSSDLKSMQDQLREMQRKLDTLTNK